MKHTCSVYIVHDAWVQTWDGKHGRICQNGPKIKENKTTTTKNDVKVM